MAKKNTVDVLDILRVFDVVLIRLMLPFDELIRITLSSHPHPSRTSLQPAELEFRNRNRFIHEVFCRQGTATRLALLHR
jgi:hypothetical protein